MLQAEIIAAFHAGEAEQVQREREREREKRGRKRDEIERSCQRSATSFAGTILFAQTARNNDSFSLIPLPCDFTL